MIKCNYLLSIIVCLALLQSCNGISKESNLRVVNFKKDTLNISKFQNKVMFVFASRNSCHDCYRVISAINKQLSKEINTNIRLIALIPQYDNYTNRQSTEFIKDVLEQDSTLFDISIPSSQSKNISMSNLFQRFNVEFCPSILIKNNENFLFIPYSELFQDNPNEEKKVFSKMKEFLLN